MSFRICQNCGAYLDPCERCDCQERREDTPAATGMPSKESVMQNDTAIIASGLSLVNHQKEGIAYAYCP